MSALKPIIGVLGGTGGLGTGLASRWLQAGYQVIIGSRSIDKGTAAVDKLTTVMAERGNNDISVSASDYAATAREADIVVLTVPFSHQASTLAAVREQLQGKTLIDTTVPLVPPKVSRVQLPQQGSAGQIAQEILGESVHVVSAFQNVPAPHLQAEQKMDCDVLVCGNSKEARSSAIELVAAIGMRGLHAGPIENSAAVEAMTSLLIFVNKQHGCHAGIRITGIE
ncbi:NADPH-dependent F420 reductase [Microbulbifer sp. SAOS-129_SWC]|uniref:NADPH-dependent F420 reductase n=1 Tax=Microbulbifer sp. SAOS-129_SWC TaxID=3145235 RepID=UPI0032162313